MIVRSIVQLPLENDPSKMIDGQMEMSLPQIDNPTRYRSNKILYSTMRNDIQKFAVDNIVSTYSLSSDDGSPLSLNDLYSTVNTISAEDIEIDGKKQLAEWPWISADFPTNFNNDLSVYGDDGWRILPNVKKVREMINDNAIFISTTSSLVAEGNPLPMNAPPSNQGIPGYLSYGNTIGSNKFYYWQIDDGGNDSSKSIFDVNSGSHDGYELIRDTGNLVVWGWLADNPDNPPDPQCCWVAMYAKLKCEGYNDTQLDVPISVKPWIRGVNAPTLQYIGFNIPVKAGLRIKMVTGFQVNGKNSNFQSGNSLTFKDQWVPNAFYGYVIK